MEGFGILSHLDLRSAPSARLYLIRCWYPSTRPCTQLLTRSHSGHVVRCSVALKSVSDDRIELEIRESVRRYTVENEQSRALHRETEQRIQGVISILEERVGTRAA